MADDEDGVFVKAAQGLAEAFGEVTAAAVDPLSGRPHAPPRPRVHPSLYKQGQMRRRLDQLVEAHGRYGHPFGLVVFDVEGPGTRNRSEERRVGKEGRPRW